MKVTPINRKFGKYEIGQVFNLPDKAAKIFIKLKKLEQVFDELNEATVDANKSMQGYSTRMLTAETQVIQSSGSVFADLGVDEPEAELPVEAAVEDTHASGIPVDAAAPYGYKADGTPRKRPNPHDLRK